MDSKKKKKLIIIIAAVLVLVLAAGGFIAYKIFFATEEEPEVMEEEVPPPPEPIPAPIQYEVNRATVIALPVGDTVTVYYEETEKIEEESQPENADGEENADADADANEAADAEADEAADEEADAEADETTDGEPEEAADQESEEGAEEEVPMVGTYRYEGLPSLQRVWNYCTMLTEEDFGFVPVDEELYEMDALPNLEETDHIWLARYVEVPVGGEEAAEPEEEAEDAEAEEAAEVETETYLQSLRLSWGENWCLVTPELLNDRIKKPASQTSVSAGSTMTMMEAVDYVKGLSPANLGLEGESMEEYRIYALDGAAIVEGTPCLRLNIYDISEESTNIIMGQYLLSNDGTKMFRVTEEGKAKPLDF